SQVVDLKDLPPEVLAMADTAPVDNEPPAVAAMPESVASAWTSPLPASVPPVGMVMSPAEGSVPGVPAWESGLQAEAQALLEAGRTDVWDVLTHRFETCLIQTALANTRGRRIEAAQKLGIGRNTITRKIQELNLE
ncbi:MAG: nitrogen regulation protein NR(I), partial [Gammaproteobacteria bacterium]|nr:nitrogen regulation protein NR(I) [Gammaproteobacteria bacterium]